MTLQNMTQHTNAINLLLYIEVCLIIISHNEQLRNSSQICISLTNFHISLKYHTCMYKKLHLNLVFCISFLHSFSSIVSFAQAINYVKLLVVLIIILERKVHFSNPNYPTKWYPWHWTQILFVLKAFSKIYNFYGVGWWCCITSSVPVVLKNLNELSKFYFKIYGYTYILKLWDYCILSFVQILSSTEYNLKKSLVSLFNAISTFEGCLMLKPSF